MALKPVSNDSLRARVAASLRASILDGTLAAGTKLTEPDLAAQLKTSRGPIREALRDLEQEGFVKSHAHHSVRVLGAPSREEVLQVLVPIRIVIEVYAFGRACEQFAAAEIQALASLVDDMRGASEAGDAELLGDLDVEFHRYVVDRTGHEQGAQIWRALQPRIRAHFRKEQRDQVLADVVDEHVVLLEALEARDPDLLAARVREHILTFPSAAPDAAP